MKIFPHINSIFNSVSYLLIEDNSFKCRMIDAGDANPIIELIGGNTLMGIFLTHSHYDHIYGLNDFLDRFPYCKIYTNSSGAEALKDPMENLSFFHDASFCLKDMENVRILSPNETFALTNNKIITAIYTPGHHPSCITWMLNDILFTGDSYIPGLKIETRLSGGDSSEAVKSSNLIKKLGIGNQIFPGHQ